MYLEGKDQMMVVRDALTVHIEKLRIEIHDAPIPAYGSLSKDILDTKMKSLAVATDVHQRCTIHLDRIKHQTT